MRIGIIAEGKSDQAVLTNILKGKLDIDKNKIVYIQPENYFDETDLNSKPFQNDPAKFSNWALVLEECKTKLKITDFFDNPIDENKFLVIHIDTAESHEKNYDIEKPNKKDTANYVEEMRNLVADKIKTLLVDTTNNIALAIAVEEIDAWVLTIYQNQNDRKDTGLINNPKEKLEAFIKKDKKLEEIGKLKAFDKYYELSKKLRKSKYLKECANKNKSLEIFCNELDSL